MLTPYTTDELKEKINFCCQQVELYSNLHKTYMELLCESLKDPYNQPSNEEAKELIKELRKEIDAPESLIMQLPYIIKTDSRRKQAEDKRKDIENQLVWKDTLTGKESTIHDEECTEFTFDAWFNRKWRDYIN